MTKLKHLGGLIGHKYRPDSLEELLRENFEDLTLEDVQTNVLVTACTTTGKPKLFKGFSSEEARQRIPGRDKKHKLWEIERSISATPTYFPAYKPTTYNDSFVDGGIWINNPSTLVTASMVKDLHGGKFYPNNLSMLSLGTCDMSLQRTFFGQP